VVLRESWLGNESVRLPNRPDFFTTLFAPLGVLRNDRRPVRHGPYRHSGLCLKGSILFSSGRIQLTTGRSHRMPPRIELRVLD